MRAGRLRAGSVVRRDLQLSGAAAALLAASSAVALAKPADCLLQIAGRTYIDGPCNFSPDTDGSFTIAAGDYFATLLVDSPGVGQGYWNETPGAGHAHSPLGTMRRNQACWVNAKARLCAWRPGERRGSGG